MNKEDIMTDVKDTDLNPGAEPGTNDGVDPQNPTNPADPSPAKDAKDGGSSDPVPWDKDERWQSWKAKEKTMDKMLRDFGLDSIDDAVDFFGKTYQERMELQAVADEYKAVQNYWAANDMKNNQNYDLDNDDPDEVNRRLLGRVKELEQAQRRKESDEQKTQELQKAIANYDNVVNSAIDGFNGITESEKKFMKEYAGSENPFASVNIHDPIAVRRAVGGLRDWLEDYRQAIITDYRNGKTDIPDVTPVQDAAIEDKKPKNMKEASKLFKDALLGKIQK